WAVMSRMRAAGMPPTSTVKLPRTTRSGGPAQTAMSVTRADGRPLMSTRGAPGAISGPPTWGTRTVTIGQTCMSVSRAAGIMGGLLPVGPVVARSGLQGDRSATCPPGLQLPRRSAAGDLQAEIEEAAVAGHRLGRAAQQAGQQDGAADRLGGQLLVGRDRL